MPDVLHIEPARTDVCGDHDGALSRFERADHEVPLPLLLVSVNRQSLEVFSLQTMNDVVTEPFRLHEDQHFGSLIHRADLLQQAAQLLRLLVRSVDDLDELGNRVSCSQVYVTDVDVHRVLPAEISCQCLHLPRPGCGPEERLPVFADHLHDLPNLWLEAHVQHPVGLVEDQEGDPLEVCRSTLEEVEESPGSSDRHVRPPAELTHLRSPGSTSVDCGCSDPA
mmetsp:Transcript_30224/g.59345  ORF Transcript_30224/g.59345 Transcript_30224/m.59345 type:complete len:223 (+) Transcript_30224:563-1231(+)